MRRLLILLSCLTLTSCGTVGDTLDCVDLWRFDNCILLDHSNRPVATRGGDHCVGGKFVGGPSYARQSYNYKANSYASAKITPPEHSFRKPD